MSNEHVLELDVLRAQIASIDAEIVQLLARRLEVARQAGDIKRELGVAVLDPAREAAVVSNVAQLSRDNGLPEDDMRAVYWRILAMARGAQEVD